jgi:hypothetical protein
LHSSGALTDDEFTAAKKRLLNVDHNGAVDENGERHHGAEER